MRNYSGSGGGDMGVGMNEAKHWHRRAYGGLVSSISHTICAPLNHELQGNATQMLPEELGHAAAYEAFRTWMHNSSIYEPLSGDVERQREGLIGIAIAEGDFSCATGTVSLANLNQLQPLDSWHTLVVQETATPAWKLPRLLRPQDP